MALGPIQWSPFQQDIFEAIEHRDVSLQVIAVAGSGKSTTIIEGIKHVPPDKKVVFLAFNKAIADSLKARVTAPNARCMTLHSAGNAAWRTMLSWDSNSCELDSRKTSAIVSRLLSWPERTKYGGQMGKLVSIAKGQGIMPNGSEGVGLVEDDDSVWEEMIDFYGLDAEACSIPLARRVLAESIRIAREVIDFDDQLYMPIITQAPFEQYDVVFIDELQDLNGLQHEIVARLVASGGRVVGVGDPYQSCYGFRGALTDSMERFAERFKCELLPLSISYRCPKAVVRHAQQWVGHILPSETAIEGLVETDSGFWKAEDFEPTDVILCRVNKPLVALAFRLIRLRVPCRIAGRDIGKGLVDLVNKMKASDIPELCDRLESWQARETKRAKGDQAKIASARDKVDTINVFVDAIGPDATVADLTRSIEGMFTDNNTGMLTLSSIHKAKGLEWDRVFVLDAQEHMPSPWARTEWQREQEVNLMYVAATRARRELRYIQSEGIR